MDQVAPTPRFSRTSPELRLPPPAPGEHSEQVLAEYGFDDRDISRLRENGDIV
jgi:alpha-methylacyl-CoA racemase